MNDYKASLTKSVSSADGEFIGTRKDLESRTLYFPKELS